MWNLLETLKSSGATNKNPISKIPSQNFSTSMKWDMEIEEVEAVLGKIWDLHDKLSDAIHSISRAHFLNTIRNIKQKSDDCRKKQSRDSTDENRTSGYVYVKDFGGYEDSIQEAKSLNLIRTALENLEDQLEFFRTVQIQQRAERDAAIARLEQSRIVLAMRLANHHGEKHKVIEEAAAFIGDVQEAGRFISPENLFSSSDVAEIDERDRFFPIKFLISSFNIAKNSLKSNQMGGILGNAVSVAVTMIAILNFSHTRGYEQRQQIRDGTYQMDSLRKSSRLPRSRSGELSVISARG